MERVGSCRLSCSEAYLRGPPSNARQVFAILPAIPAARVQGKGREAPSEGCLAAGVGPREQVVPEIGFGIRGLVQGEGGVRRDLAD